ncbi:MAG: hypothetical protein J6Y60_12930, partial [Treponema sp.]|nr:hypothetical protein [Treponema sp.]
MSFLEKSVDGWKLNQRRGGSLPVLWKKRFDLSPRPTGPLPSAAWPGCERWRSGDETKMPLPVASRTVSNKHTATFFQNNTLSSLLFR